MTKLTEAAIKVELDEIMGRISEAAEICKPYCVPRDEHTLQLQSPDRVHFDYPAYDEIRASLSNHQELRFDNALKGILTGFHDLWDLLRHYNPMQDHEIQMELAIKLTLDPIQFQLGVDGIELNGRSGSPRSDFTTKFARIFARHAALPLTGAVKEYNLMNSPHPVLHMIRIKAPSEGLAIARLGTLYEMSLEQMHAARTGEFYASEVLDQKAVDKAAKDALASVGL